MPRPKRTSVILERWQLLAMVPQPVKAVVLLFPVTETFKEAQKSEDEIIKSGAMNVHPKVFWMKQTVDRIAHFR